MTDKKTDSAANAAAAAAQPQANNNSLDPRAIQLLLDAVDLATKRGTFNMSEMGNIVTAYNHTKSVMDNMMEQTRQQQGQPQTQTVESTESNKGDE